jgi:hypothetical protein
MGIRQAIFLQRAATRQRSRSWEISLDFGKIRTTRNTVPFSTTLSNGVKMSQLATCTRRDGAAAIFLKVEPTHRAMPAQKSASGKSPRTQPLPLTCEMSWSFPRGDKQK